MTRTREQRQQSALAMINDYGSSINEHLEVCPELLAANPGITVYEALLADLHNECQECGGVGVVLTRPWAGTCSITRQYECRGMIEPQDWDEFYEDLSLELDDYITIGSCWETAEEVYGFDQRTRLIINGNTENPIYGDVESVQVFRFDEVTNLMHLNSWVVPDLKELRPHTEEVEVENTNNSVSLNDAITQVQSPVTKDFRETTDESQKVWLEILDDERKVWEVSLNEALKIASNLYTTSYTGTITFHNEQPEN